MTTERQNGGAGNLDDRINRMFKGDVLWAFSFVVVLWAVYLFVFYEVIGAFEHESVRVVLMISGGMVLLFNTAAIVAMVRHYAHEKRFIYGLDIRHLDEMRANRNR